MLKLRIYNQLVSCDDADGLFFMINFMIANLRHKITTLAIGKSTFYETRDFVDAFKHYPASTVAAHRQKRPYMTNILVKNEVRSKYKTNFEAFIRLAKGEYLLNPLFEVEISEGKWMNLYDLSGLTELETIKNPVFNQFATLLNIVKEMLLKSFLSRVTVSDGEAVQSKDESNTPTPITIVSECAPISELPPPLPVKEPQTERLTEAQ
jgi:hypothetical protein